MKSEVTLIYFILYGFSNGSCRCTIENLFEKYKYCLWGSFLVTIKAHSTYIKKWEIVIEVEEKKLRKKIRF